MKELFTFLLTQPIFNGFVGLYNIIPDVGVVIILITIIMKFALLPTNTKAIQAQKSLTELQPKLDELKKKQKGDQQAVAQETMKLYKEHKVNPFGSCLPLLIQLPIFLALYWVLRDALNPAQDFHMLYSFVSRPESINPLFFGLLDLEKPQFVLGALAAAAQYYQAKMFTKKRAPTVAGTGGADENMAAMMNKQMTVMMPILTLIIGFSLPGGLLLYWFISTLFTLVQQIIVFKKHDDVKEGKLLN
ncbi:MAG: YidC/Oxa1 family membrane protein insertase [Candidatus Magasanikbacteria bacterium]